MPSKNPQFGVLYITSRMPYPPHSGGQLREYQLLRRLSARTDVHLVVVTQFPEVDRLGITRMQEFCVNVVMVAADPVNGPRANVPSRVWRQSSSQAHRLILELHRRHAPSLVHVEGYYMMQHLPGEVDVPILLIEENVEYQIDSQWEALLGETDAAGWEKAAEMEVSMWRKATVCGFVSEDDLELAASVSPGLDVRLSPNGWDHLRQGWNEGPYKRAYCETLSALFVGNYSYRPSEDAASYLLKDVWPIVASQVPNSQLTVAGACVSPKLSDLASATPQVVLAGFVPELSSLLDKCDVFVAPLRVGGGIKVKVLEAVSRGCPIVSTPLGVQGLPPSVQELISIGSEAYELADAIVDLFSCRDRRQNVGARLRASTRKLPTWDEASTRLWSIWTSMLV